MRDKLKSLVGSLITITGTFVRYGVKEGDGSKWNTAIITGVRRGDEIISDHLWFTMAKAWLKTELTVGTEVKVTGKVYKYKRSNGSIDYGLQDTRELVVVKRGEGDIAPAKQWNSSGFEYFKYLTNTGPRWYKAKDGNVVRVEFKYVGTFFQESLLNLEPDDSKYTELIQKIILQ
jgi:hypothetical protein